MEKTITKLKFSTDQWTPTLSFKMKLNKNIRINSAFLVNLYGYSLGKEGIYLISDYSDDGSLHDYVHGGGRSKFSVNNLIKLMLDAAEVYSQIRHIIHIFQLLFISKFTYRPFVFLTQEGTYGIRFIPTS